MVEAHSRWALIGRCLAEVELGKSGVADTEQAVHEWQQRAETGAPVQLVRLQ